MSSFMETMTREMQNIESAKESYRRDQIAKFYEYLKSNEFNERCIEKMQRDGRLAWFDTTELAKSHGLSNNDIMVAMENVGFRCRSGFIAEFQFTDDKNNSGANKLRFP